MPLPCSLLHKPLNSLLLARLSILSLATQIVPSYQNPGVNRKYTFKSKGKHLLLVIKLWNESHRAAQDDVQNAARLMVHRNEVALGGTLKVFVLFLLFWWRESSPDEERT